jgi:hypothetical protein
MHVNQQRNLKISRRWNLITEWLSTYKVAKLHLLYVDAVPFVFTPAEGETMVGRDQRRSPEITA